MPWGGNKCKHRKCPDGHEWACTSKLCPECNKPGDVVCIKRKCKKCGHEWECFLVDCPECGTRNWPLEDTKEKTEKPVE